MKSSSRRFSFGAPGLSGGVALIALLWRFRMPLEAPPGALSHFLLAGCLWFFTSSLLLWLWLLLAFALPLLPLLPLISYTTCPLPLCVVIAPFFLAFISFF